MKKNPICTTKARNTSPTRINCNSLYLYQNGESRFSTSRRSNIAHLLLYTSGGNLCRSYAGSIRSSERMTLMRFPSRIVNVGRTFKYRSKICSELCDKLDE